jgi:hypothetical protein
MDDSLFVILIIIFYLIVLMIFVIFVKYFDLILFHPLWLLLFFANPTINFGSCIFDGCRFIVRIFFILDLNFLFFDFDSFFIFI